MKILMFSADPTILDNESSAAKRMVEYGRRVEKLDILVLTPHLASATEETRAAMSRLAAENIIAALSGETPLNIVKI